MTGDATTGVVVVGAGVAGLVVARELAVAGVEVTVLEASGRTGGCVASQEVAGLVLDAGAESFATRTTAVSALLADLGLGDDVVAPAPLGSWAQLADGAVPLPRTGLLGVPVTPWSADVRRAVGVLGALRACLDRVLPARVGVPDGPVSLASVVRARMGRRVLERLVAPVVTGVHATDPSVLDLDAAMPGVRAALRTTGSLGAAVGLLRASAPPGAAAAGLRGGMHRLPQALSSQVTASGGVVRTGVSVSGIERSDQGWTITTDAGPVTARHVVLAVPGPVAAALLRPVAGAAAALVSAAPDPRVVLATLVLRSAALDAAPRGTGLLVSTAATDVEAKGLTHSTAKWPWLAEVTGPGVHVVRLSYGRPDRAARVDQETALADTSRLLGVAVTAADLLGYREQVWETGLPVAMPGHRERVAALRVALAEQGGLSVTGAWVAGTGLAAVVTDARAVAESLIRTEELRAG